MAGKRGAPTPQLRSERYAPPDVQIKKKLGGGVLKELVIRELPSKKVLHYALAYINTSIFADDNGRVIGYDNSHEFSHKQANPVPSPVCSVQMLGAKYPGLKCPLSVRKMVGT